MPFCTICFNVTSPDMFILGFQEIVPLNAQQILQTDPEKRCAPNTCLHLLVLTRICRLVWEAKILDTLNRRSGKKEDYAVIRSDQLVGTALLVLVKTGLLSIIRKVEATTRKVSIRLCLRTFIHHGG